MENKKCKRKAELAPLINIRNQTQINNHGLNKSAEASINGQLIIISIDELENIGHLGKGCYGTVEKMRHRPSDHIFAVKMIRNETASQRQNRLLNDLVISRLCTECPYIVNSHCALLCGGDIWICMELMDTNLDVLTHKIPEGEYLPDPLLAYIVFCIVSGLSFLHTKKVIHRDVKPSNVLLDRRGRVQLCDFGISGFLINSKVKTNVGTRLYLSPERIKDEGKEYSVKADVWSLGVTVVEVGSHQFPFERSNRTIDQMVMIADCKVLPTLPMNAPYSDEAHHFVTRCLDLDPEARASYTDLLAHQWLIPVCECVRERASQCGQYVTTMLHL